jgi:ATP-dependent exoDNAse (exonuclease V) alpha subunit
VVLLHAAITFKVISRASGRSAVAASAYRSHTQLNDERYEKNHDYTRKGHGLHNEVLAPSDAPAWAKDRNSLWNEVERVEKRKDAQLAREVVLTLPRDVDPSHYPQLVRDFAQEAFVSKGMVADIAIENPPSDDGKTNPHAHIMLTMRSLSAEGFGNKNRDWNKTAFLEQSRRTYEKHLNQFADAHGLNPFNLRSNEAKGLGEPQPKKGVAVTAMERKGIRTQRGDEVIKIKQQNWARSHSPRNPLSLQAAMDDIGRRYYQAAYGSEAAYGDRGYFERDFYGRE